MVIFIMGEFTVGEFIFVWVCGGGSSTKMELAKVSVLTTKHAKGVRANIATSVMHVWCCRCITCVEHGYYTCICYLCITHIFLYMSNMCRVYTILHRLYHTSVLHV